MSVYLFHNTTIINIVIQQISKHITVLDFGCLGSIVSSLMIYYYDTHNRLTFLTVQFVINFTYPFFQIHQHITHRCSISDMSFTHAGNLCWVLLCLHIDDGRLFVDPLFFWYRRVDGLTDSWRKGVERWKQNGVPCLRECAEITPNAVICMQPRREVHNIAGCRFCRYTFL